jgi:hypothetical protein
MQPSSLSSGLAPLGRARPSWIEHESWSAEVADVDKGDDASDREAELLQRVDALEREIAAMRLQVRTGRLVVVDEAGRERLVAGLVGPAIELRLPLAASTPSRITEVVLFAVEGRDGLAGGVGVQLWGDGTVVRELTLWQDELPS